MLAPCLERHLNCITKIAVKFCLVKQTMFWFTGRITLNVLYFYKKILAIVGLGTLNVFLKLSGSHSGETTLSYTLCCLLGYVNSCTGSLALGSPPVKSRGEVLRLECLYVCLLTYLKIHMSKFYQIFCVTFGRGSVLLWWQCNKNTSGFISDAHVFT